jgi:hypothetical protein
MRRANFRHLPALARIASTNAHQFIDIDSMPRVPDQQVLTGCERPDALIKALDKVGLQRSGGR